MAFADTQQLVVQLDLKGNLNAKLGDAARAIKGFDKATSNTQRSLGKLSQNLQRGLVLGAGAAAGGFLAVAKAAGDFEAQLNTINTIARANVEDLGKIGDAIRKVARDSGTPLDDLTTGYYDLLSAGIKAADATDVLTKANTLAIGGLSTTAEAIDLLTTTINTYGGDASKAAEYTDVFAKAIERGKVTAAELSQSFSQVGPIAAASGISIQELGAAYARLTSAGVPAAEAATDVRSAIVALTRTTPALEDLQKQTGKNYLSIAGRQGLVVALEQMRNDAKKSGVPLIDLLGRVEGLNFALLTTGPNFKAYNADLAAMGDASGTAAEQMAERQKGLNFQLSRLKALAKDAGITIGSALLPKLTPLVSKLNDFITKNQGKIAEFGGKLADGFEKFATAIGKIDWQPFIDGLRISADIAKEAIRLFMSLPDGVKAAAIGGFAVNKLTGGLPVSVAKDVGGALLGRFAERGSSPTNALWVRQAGGSGGGGGAVATGGKGGGLLAAAGKVFLVGAAIGVFSELKGILDNQSQANKEAITGQRAQNTVFIAGANMADLKSGLAGIEAQEKRLMNEFSAEGAAFQFNIDGVRDAVNARGDELRAAISAMNSDTSREDARILGASEKLSSTTKAQLGGVINQVRQAERSQVTADAAIRAATAAAAQRVAAEVRDKDLSVRTSVTAYFNNYVKVSNKETSKTQTTKKLISGWTES